MSVRYWIAQHVTDVFRNEPRNIGIFVKANESCAARFFAETETGVVDGRKLRGWSHPEVYRQWIEYWRKEVSSGSLEELLETSGSHYRVIEGGEVTDVGFDLAEDVANYLYALLVSAGGFGDAIAVEDAVVETSVERAVATLEDEIAEALLSRKILVTDDDLLTQHPAVRRKVTVQGKVYGGHKPSFTQQNGRLYVMEGVDFTTSRKKAARDHAGWTAYMFKDIQELNSEAESISVVRLRDADRDFEEVNNGLALLRAEGRVINWLNDDERNQFLNEREAAAGITK